MILTAKSPCRVDLAGGTLDIWPLYLFHDHSCTVNFAIDRYTSCRVVTRPDRRIKLAARDIGRRASFASIDALIKAAPHYDHTIGSWLLRWFRPETGLDLETHSESPAGAGIAGSSALMITVASALNRLCARGYSLEKIREVAQNVEAQIISVPTGSQDYYPALYGGVSVIELTPAGFVRKAIPVGLDAFESRVVLAYTGEPRDSGINNWEVTKAHIDGSRKVRANFAEIAAISHAMRGALEKSDWTEVARLLRAEWTHRRRNDPGITTPLIDRLVARTAKLGARAAKVCGAGGGGCVLFWVEPDARERVRGAITAEGAEILDVRVARQGVKVKVEG